MLSNWLSVGRKDGGPVRFVSGACDLGTTGSVDCRIESINAWVDFRFFVEEPATSVWIGAGGKGEAAEVGVGTDVGVGARAGTVTTAAMVGWESTLAFARRVSAALEVDIMFESNEVS